MFSKHVSKTRINMEGEEESVYGQVLTVLSGLIRYLLRRAVRHLFSSLTGSGLFPPLIIKGL